MTVSDITGIPRATVVRKLKKLISNKLLTIDAEKLYYPSSTHLNSIRSLNEKNIKYLIEFITKTYTQMKFVY